MDPQYRAGSRTVAKRDTDAAAGENLQLIRDRVIENEFGWSVDKNAGRERHWGRALI